MYNFFANQRFILLQELCATSWQLSTGVSRLCVSVQVGTGSEQQVEEIWFEMKVKGKNEAQETAKVKGEIKFRQALLLWTSQPTALWYN